MGSRNIIVGGRVINPRPLFVDISQPGRERLVAAIYGAEQVVAAGRVWTSLAERTGIK